MKTTLKYALYKTLWIFVLIKIGKQEDFKDDDKINNPSVEMTPPVLYNSAAAESPELEAHQNRVFNCSDHPGVESTHCKKASDVCFCNENEVYTFSFCRKSCGYCIVEDTIPKEFWRVRALGNNKPLVISSIQFFFSRFDDKPATVEHHPILSQKLETQKTNEIKLHGNGWFEHKINQFDASSDSYIGHSFGLPVIINAVRLKFGKNNKHDHFVIESGYSLKGEYAHRWNIRRKEKPANNMYYKHNCPILWKKYETINEIFCFKIIAEYKSWEDARVECKAAGADLTSIRSPEENEFVVNSLKPCGKIWIGYNKLNDTNKYLWSDGYDYTNFTNWNEKEMRSTKETDEENCAYIDSDGVWSTDVCKNNHYFICRKEIDDYRDIKLDLGNINIDPPVLFFSDDFSKPVLNTSETTERREKEDKSFEKQYAMYIPREDPEERSKIPAYTDDENGKIQTENITKSNASKRDVVSNTQKIYARSSVLKKKDVKHKIPVANKSNAHEQSGLKSKVQRTNKSNVQEQSDLKSEVQRMNKSDFQEHSNVKSKVQRTNESNSQKQSNVKSKVQRINKSNSQERSSVKSKVQRINKSNVQEQSDTKNKIQKASKSKVQEQSDAKNKIQKANKSNVQEQSDAKSRIHRANEDFEKDTPKEKLHTKTKIWKNKSNN